MQQYHELLLPRLKIFKHKSKEGVVERVSICILRIILCYSDRTLNIHEIIYVFYFLSNTIASKILTRVI